MASSSAAINQLSAPIRVLGVDPGLNITGYAVLQSDPRGPKVCEAGVIRGKSKGSLTRRVAEIHEGLSEVIENLQPNMLALEELYSHYQRPKTAILMGHARGVICLAAASAGISVKHYAATRIKKVLTGNGRASKKQVQTAVVQELRLREVPEPFDVTDALAIALCHYYLVRSPGIEMAGKRMAIGSLPPGSKVSLPALPSS
ncbi:Crossover junction endodeoxyribonuclease RuvC [Planctomycetales bacterium 10988]|nr:Crossover junction endodeoxyribonuclease RuvC [Planctomycetales bacterium 10988]